MLDEITKIPLVLSLKITWLNDLYKKFVIELMWNGEHYNFILVELISHSNHRKKNKINLTVEQFLHIVFLHKRSYF